MAETQTLDARVAALGGADAAPRRSLWRRIEPTALGISSFVVLLLIWQIVPYFVPLSTLEFRLLYYLASRPNRVFTRDQLLDAVWGTDRFVTPRSVDVYVRRLREKIESDPENPVHLKTVRGAGYLFETRAA